MSADRSKSLALAFNQARNALIAGRSALACREPLSDHLREEMSRAITACEDAVLALPTSAATGRGWPWYDRLADWLMNDVLRFGKRQRPKVAFDERQRS